MVEGTRGVQWLLLGIALSAVLAVFAVLFYFDPSNSGFYPTCLFHSTTGLLCPGCGSLRAMHQLLHGHLLAALRFNALLVLCLPLCGGFLGLAAFNKFKRRPMPILSAKCIWLFAIIALVFALWRNLPGSPLAMLPG